MINDPEYDRWLRTVPADITNDTLWRTSAYRFALFAMSQAQADIPLLTQCRETRPHIDQLLRAHFYEYALSTAREARGWYYRCARALPAETLAARMGVFTQIIRLLTKTVPEVRASKTRWRPRREPDTKPLPDPNE